MTTTGRELVEAVTSAMATMGTDSRLDSVEVTIPLGENGSTTGSYTVSRNGAIRRVA